MNALPARIKLTTWLALVALLALALMPTLARAINRAQVADAQWAEVSTAQGVCLHELQGFASGGQADDIDGDIDGAMAQAAGDLDHCPDCSLEGHELAPPPTRMPPLSADGADYLAPLFLQAPHTLFAWRSPRSRAPPL